MKTINILLFILLSYNQIGFAQNTVLKNTHKGNLFYLNGAYKDAIYSYEKALQESPFNFKANFNLGNAFFKMEEYDKAIEILEPIAERAKTSSEKAMVYHNIGNCYMMKSEFEDAIEAYKNGLRLNPRDEATRYNLTYALLKQQQKEQQQQKNDQNKDQKEDNKDQKENQDQNGEDQKGDKNKDDNQNQKGDEESNDDQNQKDEKQNENDGNEKDQQERDTKPKPNKLSKEQAKRLLEAAAKKEKETQKEKDKNLKVGTAKPKAKKDW